MEERNCHRCGKRLQPGGLNYVVNIRVFADFDGILLEPEEGVDQQLGQLLRQVEKMDPGELEKEVYEEFNLILCKSCRDRFVHETQHPWEGPFRMKGGPKTILH
ncbi:MAG: hypothetical protein ACPL6D_06885 [Thermodesulfobacteriota bacterium]